MHTPEEQPGSLTSFKNAEILKNLSPETSTEIPTPAEGGTYEADGKKYRFVRKPTGTQVWNPEAEQMEPGYHSLRTWFSHSTPGVTDGGPGWDSRLGLLELSPDEMRRRYGHVFTRDEIRAPAGKPVMNDDYEEKLVGGMPDDIPYYGLERIQDNP